MATQFQFPPSYAESLMPQTNPAPTGPAEPASASALHELLSSLENPTVPQPPQVKTWQRILGALGDAIGAAATVRAGGVPNGLGPFAANLRQRQLSYQQQSLAAQNEGRETRNKVRIGAFEEAQKQAGAEKLARVKSEGQRPGVSWQTQMVNGAPHTIQVITDPQTGAVIHTLDFGEKFVPPAISPYTEPETGAINLGRVSRTTGTVAPVTVGGKQVGAVPPPGVVSDVSKTEATIGGLDKVMEAYHEIRSKTADQSPIGQWLRERAVQNAPGPMSAWQPDYANYVATRQAALNAYIKSVTGAQFSVAELKRYENQFPEPWDPENVATNKLSQLRDRAVADMRAKLKMYPGLKPESSKSDPLLEELWGGGR